MFNNPFSSFHDTVAEAKEEREQLDRLLTISTPRERLLVAGIALLLCVLAAWLFFGSVPRNLTLDGVLVEPGESNAPLGVLVWTESGVASEIKVGMSTAFELATRDGGADTLDGEVAEVAAVPLSDGMAALAPVSPHRVGIVLDGDVLLPAGVECRIVIELGRQAPVALLGLRRP